MILKILTHLVWSASVPPSVEALRKTRNLYAVGSSSEELFRKTCLFEPSFYVAANAAVFFIIRESADRKSAASMRIKSIQIVVRSRHLRAPARVPGCVLPAPITAQKLLPPTLRESAKKKPERFNSRESIGK